MSNIFSLELEKHLLSGLIRNPKVYADIASFISENDFSGSNVNKVIYSVIRQALNRNEVLDHVILGQKVKSMGITFEEDLNIFDYLEALSLVQTNEQTTLKAAQELKKFTVAREIAETGHQLALEMRKSVNLKPSEIISVADRIYNKRLNSYTQDSQPQDLFDGMEGMIEDLGNNPKEENGYATPYPTFNRLFGGLRPGNVYAFLSRPAAGKTTILTDLCYKTTILNPGVKVLMLDTEMETVDIKLRLCAAFSGVPLWYLETGNWRRNEEMLHKVRSAWPKIKKLVGNVKHFYVAAKPIEEICSIIRRWYYSEVGREGKAIISYDYIKLTGEKVSKEKQEYHVIGEKTDMLKQTSSEIGAPLLTACQLNRLAEQGIDDSSAIAQSDRLQWFASFVAITRRKTLEEIAEDGEQYGTHKMIPLKTRFQGRDAAGHHDFVKVEGHSKDGKAKSIYKQNYLNFKVENFNVSELGSLRDMIDNRNKEFDIDQPQDGSLL